MCKRNFSRALFFYEHKITGSGGPRAQPGLTFRISEDILGPLTIFLPKTKKHALYFFPLGPSRAFGRKNIYEIIFAYKFFLLFGYVKTTKTFLVSYVFGRRSSTHQHIVQLDKYILHKFFEVILLNLKVTQNSTMVRRAQSFKKLGSEACSPKQFGKCCAF